MVAGYVKLIKRHVCTQSNSVETLDRLVYFLPGTEINQAFCPLPERHANPIWRTNVANRHCQGKI